MALTANRIIDNSLPGIDMLQYDFLLREPLISQCLVSTNPKKVQNAINVMDAFKVRVDDYSNRR